jgi:hypothetical protein
MNYTTRATEEVLKNTAFALNENNFEPIVVENSEEALEKIKELIPAGVSVMNGTSKTLESIGYIEYLKSGAHPWNNLHERIIEETDPTKKEHLRKESVISDYYLGSVHALTQTGELVIASNTGSQLPHIVFTSPNLIFVVGAQKISENLDDAFNRLKTHVIPLEDERMKQVYGFGTTHAKTVILHKENAAMGRKIRVIIVKENLGF